MQIKVIAGSSRDSVDGWLGELLKVRVTARPERGKANASVERLMARTIGIPRSNVTVLSGHSSTRKVLELTGVSESEVLRRLPKGAG